MWVNHGFELFIISIIIFILLIGLYRKIRGYKGTWSDKYYYDGRLVDMPKGFGTKRGPPKESKGELECKRVLEKIFNKPFDKIRPDFLRNEVTGGMHNLEIDCYNNDLKLGVEYNGVQHYKYSEFFHKNKEAFLNQKYRDDMKRRICKESGLTLIEVPYTVKNEDIENFLRKELRTKFV